MAYCNSCGINCLIHGVFRINVMRTGEGGGTVMVMDLAVHRHSQIGSGYQMGSQLQQPGPYQDTLLSAKRGCGDVGC
jgi:hypothetical protein